MPIHVFDKELKIINANPSQLKTHLLFHTQELQFFNVGN
jgi:hypothetical protein